MHLSRLLILLFLFASLLSFGQQKIYNPIDKDASLFFEKDTFDFGMLHEGDSIHFTFKFKSTGQSKLVIRSASGSCGCTIPEWPQTPLEPNEEADIKVTFDSKGKSGMQHQVVNVYSNSPQSPTVLHIIGFVKPDKEKVPHNE